MRNSFEVKVEKINSVQDFYEKLVDVKHDYFRGESYYDWQLNSSLVRKTSSLLGGNRLVLDYDFMIKSLIEYKERYDKYISSRHSYARFLFFLQHSMSLSPFIDITKNLWIALSFALSNIEDYKDDIAIYGIKVKGNKKDNSNILERYTDIENVCTGLSVGINKNIKGSDKVEMYIVDSNDLNILNDRMLYQKGAFLLLNNYSYTNNDNNQKLDETFFELTKYLVSKDILDELKVILSDEYPKYKYEYLSEPYEIFEDISYKL